MQKIVNENELSRDITIFRRPKNFWTATHSKCVLEIIENIEKNEPLFF